MRIEKEKRKVKIVFNDDSMLRCLIHINPGERPIDFLNDDREDFIIVTEVELSDVKDVRSFKLLSDKSKKKDSLILNKSSIKLVEEI